MHEPGAVRDAVAKLTERYDRGAEVYRELWAPILRTAALPLVGELRTGTARCVLDVGTGVGALLPDLAAAFPGSSVLGVDLSRGMLTRAPARYARALMNARQLALRSESIDRVFMLFMLFHLERPESALREAHRVLRPGGCLAALTWAGDLDSPASRVWAECLDQHGAIAPDPGAEARHEAVDSPAKVESLLRRAGFDDVRSWSEDLISTICAEHLLRLKTNLGASKDRFDSLAPDVASACLDEARRRMGVLAPEDFVARGGVVCAVAAR